MRRSLAIIGVLAALAVVVGMASISSAGVSPKKFKVIEHATTDTVIDTGAVGDSTGDLLTFHNELFNDTDSTVVGSNQGQCVRIDPVAGTWECAFTNVLEGGQLMVEGPFHDTGESLFAITGGTGRYKGSRGTMRLLAGPGANEFTFMFRVIG
jgi:hypothetical protein